MSFKEKLLNKSNSYAYYKNEYDSLKKSKKKLEKENDNLNKNINDYKNELSSLNEELISKENNLSSLQSKYNKKILELNILKNKLGNTQNFDNEIILLFFGYDVQIGGLAKAVCDRANLFYNDGFSVKLINIDDLKNFALIEEKFHNFGYLNENLSIINIFDYYSKKNTLNLEGLKIDLDDIISHNDNLVNKKVNIDESVSLYYYDDLGKNIVKEELYISQYLACSKKIKDNKVIFEEYYTCDNFKYLEINKETNQISLYNRFNEDIIYLKDINDFREYFVTEICLKSNGKPILISDSSAFLPSIKNIDSEIAYKIGNAHSNPYLNKPHAYGCKMRNISAITEYEYQDASVVLTNSALNDFKKEFNSDKFHAIPNFISDDEKFYDNTYVENKVISVFCRVAPEKNLSDLIKAFSIVLKEHDDAILKIFGRAFKPPEIKEKNKLESLISELEIENSVKFMGHVDNSGEEMNKSLITVLTSNIEGFGMVIVESMYNYTPMICYDINYGPRDVIDHEVDGFIVNQNDIYSLAKYMCYALDNPKLIYDMGFLAHEKIINNFSGTVVLNKWKELFDEICME